MSAELEDLAPGVVRVSWPAHLQELGVQATLAEKPDDATLASADTGSKPDTATKPTPISGLGINIAPLSQDLKDKFQIGADQKGVVITDVAPGSSAADRGLKPGDVIVEVQQGEVNSPADVQKRVDQVRKRDVFTKYGPQARAVLDALLDKYQDGDAVVDIDNVRVLEIPPFNAMGTRLLLIKPFGGKAGFEQAVHELQDALYAPESHQESA